MLTPERWSRLEELFDRAVSLGPDERRAFVHAATDGDEEMRRELESLLDCDAASTVSATLAADAAAQWAAQSGLSLIGRTVDGYRVVSRLGAGGMGEVYLADDLALGRPVALKLLQPSFSHDAVRVRRFTDEARAASALNHPNILTVHNVGEIEGRPYIVSEFVEGETVRDRLARGPMTPREAFDVARQVAAALSASHQAGIVHRDIKPENIVIRPDGYVKVLDFGLAKLTRNSDPAGQSGATGFGTVLGTFDYMAPEQASGRTVDARADLFSLGVVLHEMLTGALPRELGSGSHPSGSSSPLPRQALRLLRRVLSTDPERRHPSTVEFQRDLDEVASAVTGHRQTRALATAIAATLIVALGGTAAWWHFYPSAPTGGSLVVMPLRSLLSDQTQQHLEIGIADAIVTRLAGVPGLHVPPLSAVRPGEDPFEAARRVGAGAVLTGSVQRSGNQLRVTVELARTADRSQIWAERFDQPFTDVFTVEDTIAQRVASSLQTSLSATDKAALTRHETASTDAYDLYLRAREQWDRRTVESIRSAIGLYQQAIALDPKFALAYAGLANCYNLTASGMTPEVRLPLARAAAEKALAIDPDAGEAHTALAFLRYKFQWRWADADREFRRAIALKPSDALAHHWYGEMLNLQNRHDESIREYQQAVSFDPFSMAIRFDYIEALINAARYDDAERVINESFAIEPGAWRLFIARSDLRFAQGRETEAVDDHLKSDQLGGVPPDEVARFREAFRTGGLPAYYAMRLQRLTQTGWPDEPQHDDPIHATTMTYLYADLHDRANTLHWLALAVDRHEDASLTLLMHRFDFLRPDPAFKAFEARVGLVPADNQ